VSRHRPIRETSLGIRGSALFIVFDDADIEMAFKRAITLENRNPGQTGV
jgi:acyl-CoA reductase-like NAD-dependent aldehyde dehydrogenase